MSSIKVKKQSLAEQLAELSNPRPVSYHPDQEDLEDLTAAKVCSFSYEEEAREREVEPAATAGVRRPGTRKRAKYLDEDDAKYAGRAISRKDFEVDDDSQRSESESDHSAGKSDESMEEAEGKEYLLDESELSPSSADEDEAFEDSDDDQTSSQSDSKLTDYEQEPLSPTGVESMAEGDDITMMSLASLQEDLEKGKAAKEQVALFDGALETRIRLQKLVAICNQLPQPGMISEFHKVGGQQLEQTLKDSQVKLRNLLGNLLGLQKLVLLKNKETHSIVGGASEDNHSNNKDNSDEEISSGSEDGQAAIDGTISSESESEDKEISTTTSKRKRKRPDWMTSSGRKEYEGYIAKTHESFRSFRDSTIEKWSKRTKIASGKVTSKAFMKVDHSVMSQIGHVLKDRERLVKRTQLKRSVYRVLGTSSEAAAVSGNGTSSEAAEDENGNGTGDATEEVNRQNPHLRDYDPEIFDDDDFYHQLLRELIERKMNYSDESSDATAMGRQWLELQKLRNKAKKKVDTKASKGRKIRYDVHPKLTNFMVPIKKGSMSDGSRNDLFSSLFGGGYTT